MRPAVTVETLGDAVRRAREILSPISPSPALDAELLLGHVLGLGRAALLARRDEPLGSGPAQAFEEILERRRGGVPVAYLRGVQEWYGVPYLVTPDVLIPRPETELLLERAVELARARHLRILADVGTGSGVLASQLACQLPGAMVYAVDTSEAALAVAARNIASLGVADRVRFLHGDLAAPVPEQPELIVANLPYLSDAMMETLPPDVRHEPRVALHGGVTGLELYRRLLLQIVERHWRPLVVVEIDPRQEAEMRARAREVAPSWDLRIECDYAGHARIAQLIPSPVAR